MLLVLLACSVDNELGKQQPDPGFETGGVPDSPGDSPADTASTEDPCNGVDDDGDGVIDEDAGDLDGDGVGDCLDDACALDAPPAEELAIDAACLGDTWAPPGDPDELVVEWRWSAERILAPPVVANLDDDDGDGVVGAGDIPEVLAVVYESGEVVALAGDGSGERWTAPGAGIGGALAVGDVDADGVPEVFAGALDTLCSYDAGGATRWCVGGTGGDFNSAPTLADLDEDGAIEVLFGTVVVDAGTGALELTGLCEGYPGLPVVGDVDGDGTRDVVCGASLWTADGTQVWSDRDGDYAASALVDVEHDGVPEVVVAGWGFGLVVYDFAGAQLAVTGPGNFWGAVCVADLDGDGDAELASPVRDSIQAFELDLDPIWSAPSKDESGQAGCAAFDFDGDGAYEVLYADEIALQVFDGATGTVRFRWDDHRSATVWEYPVIADVDHDGAAEIVLVEDDGVVVLGNPSNSWPPTDPTWPQATFSGAEVDEDGAVLAAPLDPWRGGGFARARPPGAYDEATGDWTLTGNKPELGVSIADVCAADCEDGPIQVALSVRNTGGAEADADVVLYAVDDGGEREVGRAAVTLAAGQRAAPIEFVVALADRGTQGWKATVARSDGKGDCDGEAGEDRLAEPICP